MTTLSQNLCKHGLPPTSAPAVHRPTWWGAFRLDWAVYGPAGSPDTTAYLRGVVSPDRYIAADEFLGDRGLYWLRWDGLRHVDWPWGHPRPESAPDDAGIRIGGYYSLSPALNAALEAAHARRIRRTPAQVLWAAA